MGKGDRQPRPPRRQDNGFTHNDRPKQSVVKVRRGTEAGDAPGWQGATSENTGSI